MDQRDLNSFATTIKKRDLLFTSSVAETGLFTGPGDKDSREQVRMAVDQVIEHCLANNMTPDNLVKLVIYYIDDSTISTPALLDLIATRLDNETLPVLTLVPISRQHPDQVNIVIEAVAVQTPALATRLASNYSAFNQAIQCDDLLFIGAIDARNDDHQIQFPHDIVKQSHSVLDKLDSVLAHFDAGREDIVKINNWYVAGGDAEQWAQSARVRAAYYPEPGPVATGLPVKLLNPEGALIQTDCWAMIDTEGGSIDKQFSWPDNHWDWPIHLPFRHGLKCKDMIFTGGQVSMDSQARVVDADDLLRQSHTSMKNIEAVLGEFNAGFEDIIKMTAFYQSCREPEDLYQHHAIRRSYFNQTAPQSTSVPLDYLAYQGMLTEFEVIAITPDFSSNR